MNRVLAFIFLGALALLFTVGLPCLLIFGLYKLFHLLINDGVPLSYSWVIIIVLLLLIFRVSVWIR
jgi:hypothetical protein